MKKLTTILLTTMICFVSINASAQTFDEYFEDATLRLDYIFAGNSKKQSIYLEGMKKQDRWAGRKSRLSEKFLNGNFPKNG